VGSEEVTSSVVTARRRDVADRRRTSGRSTDDSTPGTERRKGELLLTYKHV